MSPSQLSLNIGFVLSSEVQAQVPSSAHTTTSLEGQAILGTSLSITVMSKLHSLEFPQSSSTTKVTVLVPIGKAVPLNGPAV